MGDCIKCAAPLPEGALYCPMCGKKQTAEKRKRKKRANGSGTIIKKAGNRSKPWEAQKAGIYIGSYATKFEAERALANLVDTDVGSSFNMTFSQVYNEWIPYHKKTVTDKAMEGYATAYNHCKKLHNMTFRKLRRKDFQSVIDDMEENDYSKSSCEKVLQLFGQLSNWAIHEAEIQHTKYTNDIVISAKQKKEKIPFTMEQIEAIEKAKSPAKDIALILLATGCRPNELFKAEVANCCNDYFISGSKTEAGMDRVIPVSDIGIESYRKMLDSARAKSKKLLVDGYCGNKTYRNYAKRDWKSLMDELEIVGMTPYNCRHTYTTLAVKANVRPEMLQKILGHADYNTTLKNYTHLDADDIVAAGRQASVTVSVTKDEQC